MRKNSLIFNTILIVLTMSLSGCSNRYEEKSTATTTITESDITPFIQNDGNIEIPINSYTLQETTPLNDGVHISTDSSTYVLFEEKIDEIILQVKEYCE